MLEIDKLNARYGGLQALNDVSLKVSAGELVAIVGSNGAGKTTLLKSISGTVESSGSIKVAGKQVEHRKAHERSRDGIVHVPQGRHVFASMSVEENLEVAAIYRKGQQRLGFVYELFPALKEKRAQPAGNLSGGQQQMLAIGRGIMSEPVLLMLDEPSTGLAPALVDDIFDAIIRLREETKLTILLVEQRATSALAISDRAYVLEQGRIVLDGTSAELRRDDRVRQAYLGL
jgi:branched-chain amino acid transport system ATP-binding protein